jgi:uncharacterized repeat protein (TIGR01451 family)
MTTPDPVALAGISAAYGQFPISFEANQGQTDGQVSFLSRGRGYSLFLTPEETVLSLQRPATPAAADGAVIPAAASDVLRMQLIGASASPSVVGLDRLPGASNYLIGNDPSHWHTDVPDFARVEERGVYPGVDLVYYGNQQQLEYDFTVAPGADPGVIRMAFQGAESTTIDAQGNLVLRTAGGDVVEHAPVLYQEQGGDRQAVTGHYVMEGDGQAGFAVGAYDASQPLVIDPTLSYSTYLGGGNNSGDASGDAGRGIAVDAAGNVYVTGIAGSSSFPTKNPIQPTLGGGPFDAFVTKLNGDGSALVYSTYLGGSGVESGRGIAVDTAGEAFVTGETDSTNFPTTAGTFQPALAGGNGQDGFVAKLNAAGSSLVYATYLGGSGDEFASGIAVDTAGNAYVTGWTGSTNFPIENSLQASLGRNVNAFVSKLNAAGSALVYSTYLGGSGSNYSVGFGIAADAAGNAYVVGETTASTFPTTPGSFRPVKGGAGESSAGERDALLTKINPTGSAFVYSTYIGAGGAAGIAVDAAGDAFVTGGAASDFPMTPGAFQATGNGPFVTKLNAAGSALIYSSRLGGSGSGAGIAVDEAGDAFITGQTSGGLPIANALQSTFGEGGFDAFVTELNASGSALVYSTYLGGSASDIGAGIALDTAGNVYIAGDTGSTNFPTTTESYQPALAGVENAFIAKLASSQATTTSTTTVLTSSLNPAILGQPVTFSAAVTVPQGAGVATGTVSFLEGTLVLGMGTLNEAGVATLSTSSLTAGDHAITAVYTGDSTFTASTSSAVLEKINAAAATSPDLAISGSAPGAVTFGQIVTYTLTVTNGGTGEATGVMLTDTLPLGADFISATGEVHPVNGVLTFPIGDIASGASQQFKIVVVANVAGTLTNRANVMMNETDTTTVDNGLTQSVSVIQAATDGPRVLRLQRFGFHLMQTTLVLTFNKPLDPATAQKASNYQITGPSGRKIAIESAVYDPATLTVTIHPHERISIHRKYGFTVWGNKAGELSDTSGRLLDGVNSGRSATDYVTALTWRNLVLPASHSQSRHPGAARPEPHRRVSVGDLQLRGSFQNSVMLSRPIVRLRSR